MGTDESDKRERWRFRRKESMQPPTLKSEIHLKTQIEGKLPFNDAVESQGNVSEATKELRISE